MEEICIKKQKPLGAERVLCAFQQGTKHRAHSRREARVVLTAFLTLLTSPTAEGFCYEL